MNKIALSATYLSLAMVAACISPSTTFGATGEAPKMVAAGQRFSLFFPGRQSVVTAEAVPQKQIIKNLSSLRWGNRFKWAGKAGGALTATAALALITSVALETNEKLAFAGAFALGFFLPGTLAVGGIPSALLYTLGRRKANLHKPFFKAHAPLALSLPRRKLFSEKLYTKLDQNNIFNNVGFNLLKENNPNNLALLRVRETASGQDLQNSKTLPNFTMPTDIGPEDPQANWPTENELD